MRATMFERVGGFARIRVMVSAFYDKVLESDRLRPYFDGVPMRRLIDHQTKFVATLLGGPASFTDEQLARAHERLGITPADYEEVVELFRETLEDFGVPDAEVDRLHAHLRSFEPVIVGGSAEGTR